MTEKADVVGVGTAVVDYVGVVEKYPGPDSQVELQTFSKQAGGNVATAIVALSRLGVNAAFMGKFGDDELGQLVQSGLTEAGIDLSNSKIDPGGSMGFAFIVVEQGTGRRTIMWTNEGKSHLAENEVDRDAILSARYLHLDHYSIDAAIAAARIAKEGDVQTVLDAENIHPQIDTLIAMTDVLIVCEDFAQKYTGKTDCREALEAMHSGTPAHTVAITAGVNGSYCCNNTEYHRQPAFDIATVDTTGCGDVYHGAFIYGLLQQWSLEKTAEFSSAAAALNCRGLGGQSGIPDLAEVEAFLRTAVARKA